MYFQKTKHPFQLLPLRWRPDLHDRAQLWPHGADLATSLGPPDRVRFHTQERGGEVRQARGDRAAGVLVAGRLRVEESDFFFNFHFESFFCLGEDVASSKNWE